jgi:CubicO group peptidase (beta-lactamase class C family)
MSRRRRGNGERGRAARRVACVAALAVIVWPARSIAQQIERPVGGPFVFPGKSWTRIPPESAGFSRRGLDSVAGLARRLSTSALMVVVGGRSLLEYGNVAETSYVASVRKSILSMLYGRYVEDGTIRLDRNLGELGITDRGGLLAQEREATVEDLLTARSGVYHIASYAGDALDSAPPRGSQKHGTYYLYSNWDFNVAGTVFERATGRNIYDALETNLARPIDMQDYYRAGQRKDGDTTRSIHLAYPFVLSTRDMARIGYLMLREGNWAGRQLVPRVWARLSTRLVTRSADLNPKSWRGPSGYGYLWWVEDQPDTASVEYGAYAAQGAFGQYIRVIP